MARLPIPGTDTANWGALLNEYLLVAHNPDGTHRPQPAATALFVAAANAPDSLKQIAHFVCDGTDDQTEINMALEMLGTVGGQVQLSAGTFQCSGSVQMRPRSVLVGQGRATALLAHGTWTGELSTVTTSCTK